MNMLCVCGCAHRSVFMWKNMFMLVKHLFLVSSHSPLSVSVVLAPLQLSHWAEQTGRFSFDIRLFKGNLELKNSNTDVTFPVKLASAVLWLKVLHMFHNLLVTAVLSLRGSHIYGRGVNALVCYEFHSPTHWGKRLRHISNVNTVSGEAYTFTYILIILYHI